MIFSCRNIKKSFGATNVLNNITFLIEEGEKVAIVGVNGAGKSTLLKIFTNEISKDDGEIILKKGATLGYLSQMKDIDLNNTIYEEMLTVFQHLIEMENEIRDLEKIMASAVDDELSKIMEKYSRINHEFEDKKGYEYKSRIRGVIKGLGFSEEEFDQPTKFLSGGQKTRISLGKLLLTSPDLLLLDEPTNHLDIESVSWLEDVFLKNYEGAVLVISHDRYFLDKTVTKIIEIEHGNSNVYNGTYSYYAYKKEEIREIELKKYVEQQKEIKRQQEVIKQLISFNREKSVKRAESREKMLSKMVKINKPEDAPEKMRIILEPSLTSGNEVLHMENIAKTFDDEVEPLFKNISFDISRGEIVSLIGANGIGKTTIFRIITDSIPYDCGIVKLGTNVKIGYYDQEYALLNSDKTIFQEISDTYPNLKNGEIRNILAAFVFTGDDVFKSISALSGGEKGRVALAKLMLSNANFLLLDEPTNHLDMYSKEILEEALRNYTGTVLYISHDRYFINNTADRIIELNKNGVNLYLGNYDYYVEKKVDITYIKNEDEKEDTSLQNDWKQQKELEAEKRKIASRINKLEKEIEETEQSIEDLEHQLTREEIYIDYEKSSKIVTEKTKFEKSLEKLFEEWEQLQ